MVGEQYTLPRSGLLEQKRGADGVNIAVLRKGRGGYPFILGRCSRSPLGEENEELDSGTRSDFPVAELVHLHRWRHPALED